MVIIARGALALTPACSVPLVSLVLKKEAAPVSARLKAMASVLPVLMALTSTKPLKRAQPAQATAPYVQTVHSALDAQPLLLPLQMVLVFAMARQKPMELVLPVPAKHSTTAQMVPV